MSQAKVDRYKEAKANREKTLKKEKMIRRIEYGLTGLVLCGLVVWCGFSVYQKAQSAKASEVAVYEMDNSAMNDYAESLSTDTAE